LLVKAEGIAGFLFDITKESADGEIRIDHEDLILPRPSPLRDDEEGMGKTEEGGDKVIVRWANQHAL
jgi:hypothetical protein